MATALAADRPQGLCPPGGGHRSQVTEISARIWVDRAGPGCALFYGVRRLLPALLLFALAAPSAAEANRYARANAKLQRGIQRSNWRNRWRVVSPRPKRIRDLRTVLASLAHTHRYTARHSLRVAGYVEATARELGVPEAEIASLSRATMVHDIGKLKVPLSILDDKKPRADRGKTALTKKQFRTIKRHPAFGLQLLDSALLPKHPEYKLMRDAILFHHERVNGGGYGQQHFGKIPFVARLIAVADVYDSLTSKRAYRAPLAPKDALKIIRQGAGTHFDPKLVRAFEAALAKHGYRKIAPRTKTRSLALFAGDAL